jgi:hypothetical protein
MSLGRFAIRIDQLARRIDRNVDIAVKLVAVAVNQTVVLTTPVDTGQARNNWRVSLGTPITDTTSEVDPTGTTRIQSNNSVIRRRSPRARQSIYITNNLPYIEALNNGRSAQAPAGFVQRAVLDGIRALDGVRIVR